MRFFWALALLLASACTGETRRPRPLAEPPPATGGTVTPSPAAVQETPGHVATTKPPVPPPASAAPAPPEEALPPPTPNAQAAAEQPSGTGTGSPPVSVRVEIPSDEATLTTWILERAAKIPEDVSGIAGDRLRETHVIVDGLIFACEHHLKSFPKNECRADVITILAEILSINRARCLTLAFKEYKEGTGESMPLDEQLQVKQEYVARILAVIDLAAEVSAPNPLLARRLLVRAETLSFDEKYREAAAAFRAAIAAGLTPFREDRALASCGEAERLALDFAAARRTAQEFLARYKTSRLRPDMIFLEHQTYRSDGLLDEGIAHWQRYHAELEAGATGKPLPGVEVDGKPFVVAKEANARYANIAQRYHFYLGFYAFAKGDTEKAIADFQKFLEVARAAASANMRGQATQVYTDYQALPYLATIEGLCASEAPRRELGEGWIQEEGAASGEARVRLVLFCHLGNASARHSALVDGLAKMSRDFGEEELSISWIAGAARTKRRPLAEQSAEFRARVEAADFHGAYGFDIGEGDETPVHEAYMVNAGTTHLFALDRAGHVAWHLIDPMHWDEGLIRTVVERLRAAGQ